MMSVPEQFHREIDMAQKTTNKDLSQIINQMKLVRKFFNTTQVDDYKKCKENVLIVLVKFGLGIFLFFWFGTNFVFLNSTSLHSK